MAAVLFAVPFGILQDYPLANLPGAWQSWYDANYSDPTTTLDVTPGRGACILMGSKLGREADTLSLAAIGRRDEIEGANRAKENGVYWYIEPGRAVGFGLSEGVTLGPADVYAPLDVTRLSWQLDTGVGGYRSGATLDLEDSTDWHKVVMYGPCTVCDAGFYLGPQGCLPCDVGYDSFAGATSCLMRLDTAVHENLVAPTISSKLSPDSGFVLTAQVQASLPAVYGGTRLRYAFDVSNTTSLSHDAECSSLWVEETDTTFSLTIPFDDLGPCTFNSTRADASVTLSAYVGLFIVTDNGLASPPVLTLFSLVIPNALSVVASFGGGGKWGLTEITVGNVVVALGAYPSDLGVYDGLDFADPKGFARFTEGDEVFVQMRLTEDQSEDFDVELEYLWLSGSANPEDLAAVQHDLMGTPGGFVPQVLGPGFIQFMFTAVLCEDCWLHCVVRLTSRRLEPADGRFLSDANATVGEGYAWQSLHISIKEPEELPEPLPRLPLHPALLLSVALIASGVACLPNFSGRVRSRWCFVRRRRNVKAIPQGTQGAEREPQLRWAIIFFFVLEFVDVLGDIVALVAAEQAGDLEYSNDRMRLLFWAMLASTAFSVGCFVLEAAVIFGWSCRQGRWVSEINIGCRRVDIVRALIFLHMYVEDMFQTLTYAGIVIIALLDDRQVWFALVGLLQAVAFIILKFIEWWTIPLGAEQHNAQTDAARTIGKGDTGDSEQGDPDDSIVAEEPAPVGVPILAVLAEEPPASRIRGTTM